MFLHNFKYSIKVLFKNKMLLFWTLFFPIILGIFFNMAFSNIENSEKLDIINIAVIDDEDFNKREIFKGTFETLSDKENQDRIFDIKYVTLDKAKEMLEEDEITGYVLFNKEEINITVNSNGINETILKYVIDEIQSNEEIINNLAQNKIENEYKTGNFNIDYEKIYKDIEKLIENSEAKLNNISNENLSYTMIEYYTLIAMACLYGGTLSMFITNDKLANMNSKGKRAAISPIKKGRMILDRKSTRLNSSHMA